MTLDSRPSRVRAISSRSRSSCLRFSSRSRSSGFWTLYLTILRSMRMALMASELPVVAFFQRVEEVRGGVPLAVVLDLFIAPQRHLAAVVQRERISGVLQILFLHQHALERFRVEAEGGAALQPLVVG